MCICLINSTKYREDIAMQSPLHPDYLHATGVPNNGMELGAWSIESMAEGAGHKEIARRARREVGRDVKIRSSKRSAVITRL